MLFGNIDSYPGTYKLEEPQYLFLGKHEYSITEEGFRDTLKIATTNISKWIKSLIAWIRKKIKYVRSKFSKRKKVKSEPIVNEPLNASSVDAEMVKLRKEGDSYKTREELQVFIDKLIGLRNDANSVATNTVSPEVIDLVETEGRTVTIHVSNVAIQDAHHQLEAIKHIAGEPIARVVDASSYGTITLVEMAVNDLSELYDSMVKGVADFKTGPGEITLTVRTLQRIYYDGRLNDQLVDSMEMIVSALDGLDKSMDRLKKRDDLDGDAKYNVMAPIIKRITGDLMTRLDSISETITTDIPDVMAQIEKDDKELLRKVSANAKAAKIIGMAEYRGAGYDKLLGYFVIKIDRL